jgi:hypothetical protein
LRNRVASIARNDVYRVFMLPPDASNPVLPNGALLYLHYIHSIYVSKPLASSVAKVFALSKYAQRAFDYKLRNHFLREKADQLPRLT